MAETNLKKYEYNERSQFGEDGVIWEIFKRIGEGNKLCVEFGAWDGEYLSNTYNLYRNKGWKALLIEADKHKCGELKNKLRSPHIVLNRFVRPTGEDSLENILRSQNISEEIDLLSIDIDGDDYYILENLKKVRPRVIIIEYNPTIPPGNELVQTEGGYFGASSTAVMKLAGKMGYKLAHATQTNLILLLEKEFPKLNIPEQKESDFRFEQNYSYLISAYDGKNYVIGTPVYGQKSFFAGLNRFQRVLFRAFFHKKIKPDLPKSEGKTIKEMFVI
jgi:hypothetical protein